ncbi:hypothetical protein AB0G04_02880 [Actinoplanes sp. NPDC023801]|uniref:hypothetical protein n=1 Tax=Actinoplanes sp. NPDC023801 TaxID=3154595 RepID=UPI0033E3A495
MRINLPKLMTARRLVAAGTAVACVWVAAGSRTEASEVDLARLGAFSFEVTGSPMEKFHPGAVRRTRVTIANPYPFAIRVRQVDARVTGSSKWRCRPTAANLTIGGYLGSLPLTVPAYGRKTAGEFEVTMPHTVADACQRATFRLAFSAGAERAAR